MDLDKTIMSLSEKQKRLLRHRLLENLTSAQTITHTSLIAWIKPKEAHLNLKTSDYRTFLSERLPDYMIPSTIIEVEDIPLNTNGKIDRKALENSLSHHNPTLENGNRDRTIPGILLAIWRTLLGNPDIGLNDNFFKNGGDSILAFQVVTKARQAGIQLSVADIFKFPTIAELVPIKKLTAIPQLEDLAEGPFPLLPIQRWLLSYKGINPNHWNQTVLLELTADISSDQAHKAIETLWQHHDGLRLRMHSTQGGWFSTITSGLDRPVCFHEITINCDDEDTFLGQLNHKVSTFHRSTRLDKGNLFQAAYVKNQSSNRAYIVMLANHMVVDAVSWHVLQHDFENLISSTPPPSLPQKSASLRRWAETVSVYSHSKDIKQYSSFWRDQNYNKCPPIPVDLPGREMAREKSAVSTQLTLPVEVTKLLQERASDDENGMPNLILSAYLKALRSWTGNAAFIIYMEGHGREPINSTVDVSRTVGWLTSVFPVVFDMAYSVSLEEAYKETKNIIGKIPNKGIDYSIMRYHMAGKKDFDFLLEIPEMELVFNYLGAQQYLSDTTTKSKLSRTGIGEERDPESMMTCLIELNSGLLNGQLKISLKYSNQLFEQENMERLKQEFENNIRTLSGINIKTLGIKSPSFFRDASLDKDDLNTLFS